MIGLIILDAFPHIFPPNFHLFSIPLLAHFSIYSSPFFIDLTFFSPQAIWPSSIAPPFSKPIFNFPHTFFIHLSCEFPPTSHPNLFTISSSFFCPPTPTFLPHIFQLPANKLLHYFVGIGESIPIWASQQSSTISWVFGHCLLPTSITNPFFYHFTIFASLGIAFCPSISYSIFSQSGQGA